MVKRKDVRKIAILEYSSCTQNDVKKVSLNISKYITQKDHHKTEFEKNLRLLSQTYDSRKNKKIGQAKYAFILDGEKWHSA